MTHRRLPTALLIVVCAVVICDVCCWADLQVVLQTGAHSPDGNGDFSSFNGPTISSAGQLAFVGQLSGTAGGSTDNLGMFRRDTNGNLTTLARSGGTFDGKTIVTF